MADDYSQFPTVGGNAPAPSNGNSLTPEDYFSQVQKLYPNARFTGGGRTPQRNAAVGGVPNSMHLTDQAMDFQVPGVPSSQVFASLKAQGLPETEALDEGNHLHVGWRPKGGQQAPAANDYSQFPTVGTNPATPQGSDYSAFPTVKPAGPQPNPLEKGIMDLAASPFIKGVSGAYMQSALGGLVAQPVRAAMEGLGVGMNKLKAMYPGQSDQWYQTHLHDLYGQALTSARQQAYQQTKDNPYPGHQVFNTTAAVFGSADPTWFINPASAAKTMAGRVAANAALHTALGGASNAAAQVMDIAEGQKKDFDVEENLKSAALQGLFGGAIAGAHEVSPFVKNLFKQRGVDTTPQPNPTQLTSPLTQDHVQLSQPLQDEYHQLLSTGDVDDIKNFFKGRNGPQPSYEDINNWVNHRDSTTMHDPMEDTHLQPQFDPVAETQRQAVIDHINQQTAGWKNPPEFEVINHANEIADPAIRQQALDEDKNGDALGFLGQDGKVRIYGNRINDPDVASAVVYHEGLGHYGLQQQFGDKLDATLKTLMDRNVSQFGRDVKDWQAKNPGAYGGDPIRAAEEVLAEKSEKGSIQPTVADAMSASVRQFGRKMGLKLSYSDAEVKQILAMAHDAVINGKGRDVTANGFTGSIPSDQNSIVNPIKMKRVNAVGEEQTDPALLDHIDQLKQSPRFWSDPEFRKNVIELARTRNPVDMTAPEAAPVPKYASEAEARAALKFMRAKDLGFKTDNPGGDWLENKKRQAEYGRENSYTIGDRYVTAKGNMVLGPETGYFPKNLDIPVSELSKVRGAMDEQPQPGDAKYDPVFDSMKKNGYDRDWPVLVRVNHEGTPFVIEGNHRLAVAKDLGLSTVPTKISYVNGGEEVPGPWHPDKIADMISGNKGDNRYITRAQYERARESNQDYTEQTMNDLAKHLEANYTPNKVSDEETMRSALEYGIAPSQIKDLKQRDPGELAARVARLGAATEYADAKLRQTLAKLDTPDFTLDDHLNMAKQISEFHYLAARYKSEGNELGRALRTLRQFSNYTNGNLAELLKSLKEENPGIAALADPTNPESLKFARSLKAALGGANPKALNALMQGVNKPYWEQYLTSFHMNAMLSGLSTHVKAPIDMGTGIAREVMEKAIAMPIGQLRKAFVQMTGRTPLPGVGPEEMAAHVYGLARSITDLEVYRAMGRAVKTGQGEFVGPNGQATPSSFANQYGTLSNPRIPGVSLPTDLISAQDTFFRSLQMNANLRALGAREARAQLGPKALRTDVMTMGESLAQNPTLAMLKEAHDLTDRTLLLNNNKLNNALDKYRAYKPGMTVPQRAANFLVSNLAPFIRVESNNLINRVVQRSPLGFLDPYTLGEIKAGGARADIALSKIAYGSVLLGMYWAAAEKGKDILTGEGPDNVDKYKEKIAGGWEPRAVHEDGRYNVANSLAMSVNPFDLHNATATMVKAAREAADSATPANFGTMLKLASGSILHDLTNMSWIHDAAPPLSLTQETGSSAQQKVGQFVGDQAKTWVPNALGQAARLIDPNQHDTGVPESITGTALNNIKTSIPGLTNQVPIKYDVYGDPTQNGASITGVHTVIPGLQGNGRKVVTDPAEVELQRLGDLMEKSYNETPFAQRAGMTPTLITPVQKTIKLPDGTQKKLTPAEFETYQHVVGINIVAQVKEMMADPSWSQMSDDEKAYQIKELQKGIKKDARDQLFGQQ